MGIKMLAPLFYPSIGKPTIEMTYENQLSILNHQIVDIVVVDTNEQSSFLLKKLKQKTFEGLSPNTSYFPECPE